MEAQTTKPVEKCRGECCKPKTTDKNPDSKIKPVVAMETDPKNKLVACKLTSPEMQKRKEEVLDLLKEKVLVRQELANGYKFKFEGTDALLDELIAFIKSERSCCDFFVFDLSISDIKSHVWLSITGPDGTKGFIKTEMGL
jgi:hypothetical protein